MATHSVDDRDPTGRKGIATTAREGTGLRRTEEAHRASGVSAYQTLLCEHFRPTFYLTRGDANPWVKRGMQRIRCPRQVSERARPQRASPPVSPPRE